MQVAVPGDSLAHAVDAIGRVRQLGHRLRVTVSVYAVTRAIERDFTVGADGLSLGHTAAPADP